MSTAPRTIGILGAGKVGTAIARQALRAGYRVLIAGSGDPERIRLLTSIMAPGATATMADEAVTGSDLVVLALPLHKYGTLDPSVLDGAIVVDTMNYWAEQNGVMEALDDAPSSSELVQELLAGARLVKSLNHIGYHELEENAAPAGTPGRRALAAAGDDDEARAAVLTFLDRLGFDAVDAGPLRHGAAFEPGTAVFDGRFDRAGLEARLAADVAALREPLVRGRRAPGT